MTCHLLSSRDMIKDDMKRILPHGFVLSGKGLHLQVTHFIQSVFPNYFGTRTFVLFVSLTSNQDPPGSPSQVL
jgi:hypothetical protein